MKPNLIKNRNWLLLIDLSLRCIKKVMPEKIYSFFAHAFGNRRKYFQSENFLMTFINVYSKAIEKHQIDVIGKTVMEIGGGAIHNRVRFPRFRCELCCTC